MKRLSLFFLLVLPLWSVDWLHSWEAAFEKSYESNRPVLVVLMRQDCPYCQKLSSQTLSSTAIAEAIKAGFVPLYLDTDRHAEAIARSGLRAQGVPASFVVAPSGHVKGYLMGYQPPMVYMGFLQQNR